MTSVSLPPKFPLVLLERLRATFPEQYDQILAGYSRERIASFRVNTLKNTEMEVLEKCKELQFSVQPIDGIPGAFSLSRADEYRFKGSPLFREGFVYMQSVSSMLPVLVLNPRSSQSILDTCAAPGSKTTQLSALMKNTGSVVALEQNQIRMDILKHNSLLQGASNIRFEKTDALKFLAVDEESYDAIILDVPCSADGRIHFSNEKTFGFFSVSNILAKAELQKNLLESSLEHLAVGGRLVYSTCTLAPEENECVLSEVLKSRPDAWKIIPVQIESKQIISAPGLTKYASFDIHPDCKNTVRIFPNEYAEGFFIAMIERVQ